MNKPVRTRASFAAAAVAAITAPVPHPISPDEALWPTAGTLRAAAAPSAPAGAAAEGKPEKIPFSNKLEAATYLQLQQLATYSGENIQQILEAALTAYFADKAEASRPLPAKTLAALRRKHPFL